MPGEGRPGLQTAVAYLRGESLVSRDRGTLAPLELNTVSTGSIDKLCWE